MTNEERVEEILIESYQIGINNKVLQSTIKIMDENKNMSFYQSIERAFLHEKTKYDKKMNEELIEKFQFLISKMNSEGFHYCFKHYSTFGDINDKKFHELREKYVESADELNKYINSRLEELILIN